MKQTPSLWRAAVHEAGHATVAIKLGIVLDRRGVSLYRSGDRAGRTHIKNSSLAKGLAKALKRGWVKRWYFDQIMINLGGAIAEQLLLRVKGRFPRLRLGGTDRQKVIRFLLCFHGKRAYSSRTIEKRAKHIISRDKRLKSQVRQTGRMIIRRTRVLLRQNRETLRALAEELCRRKKISGPAVARFVNRHLQGNSPI